MTDKTTSIERAAALLSRAAGESAAERAARLPTGARPEPVANAPKSMDFGLAEPPLPIHNEPRPASTPPRPNVSKSVTIDFEAMSRRGLLSPLGEKTRIAEEFRLIKRFVLAKAFGRAGGRATVTTW